MKVLVFVLVLAVPTSAVAGPLQASLAREAAILAHDPRGHYEEQPIRSPTFVWLGVGMLVVGIGISVLSLTSEQRSDLSREHINTRLNRDLAPCNTDPDETTKPIADCEVNPGLLALGLGVAGTGGALILYGSRPLPARPAVTMRVRF